MPHNDYRDVLNAILTPIFPITIVYTAVVAAPLVTDRVFAESIKVFTLLTNH
jgi:hypothetical protein